MRTLSILMSLFLGLTVVHAKPGSPKRVTCEFRAKKYKEPITKLMDYNELLQNYRIVQLDKKTAECREFREGIINCDNELQFGPIVARYHFSTQNGGLDIEDSVSGMMAEFAWTNQHDVTKSGYLIAYATLVNRRGGLMGDNQIFEVVANCKASASEW